MIMRFCQQAQTKLKKLNIDIPNEYLQQNQSSQSTTLKKNYALPGFEKNFLLFENGKLRLDLSSLEGLKKATILPLKEAYRSYGSHLDSFHETLLKKEKDPLFLFHLAASEEGAFIYIPPALSLPYKLQVLYLVNEKRPHLLTLPRLHIVIGKASQLELAETRVDEESKHSTNMLLTFDLGPSSTIIHTHQSLSSKKERVISHIRAALHKDSTLTSTTLLTDFQKMNQHILLEEPNARCTIQGTWIAKEGASPSLVTHVEHLVENTHSLQVCKGIVEDKAKSTCIGLVTIAKGADRSTAKQLNQNILLGHDSKAFSQPQLAIFADDVQATHGSTTGKIDEQALLYMQSRGIPHGMAKKILLESFIREITKELPINTLF